MIAQQRLYTAAEHASIDRLAGYIEWLRDTHHRARHERLAAANQIALEEFYDSLEDTDLMERAADEARDELPW